MKKPTEQKSIFKNKAELSFISRVDPALNLTIEENNGVFSIFDKRGELTSITKTDQTGACKYIKAALIEQATEDLKSNIKNKVNCVNKCNLALIQARAKVGAYLSGTRYKLKDNGDLYAKDQKAIDLILNEIRVKNNLQMFRTAIDSGCLRVKLMTHYKISKDRYVTHEDRALVFDFKTDSLIDNIHDDFMPLNFKTIYKASCDLPKLEKQAEDLKSKISKLKFLTVGI